MTLTPDTSWTAHDWFDYLKSRAGTSVSRISDLVLQQGAFLAPHTIPKAGQYNVRLQHPEVLLEVAVGTDYVGLGSSWRSYLRVPLRPDAAQRICDALDCVLPTAGFVDALLGVGTRLPFHGGDPSKIDTVWSTNNATMLDVSRKFPYASAGEEPRLVVGHSKDVVLTNHLFEYPNNVAIYGAHGTDKAVDDPIQGLQYVRHVWNYVDYSQRVRLIHRTCRLAGKEVPTLDAIGTLKNPVPLRYRAYPVHTTTGPFVR